MDFYRARTILITGASGGIGAEFARLIAPVGARLLLVARSEGALEQVAAECRASGSEPLVFSHDLAQTGAAQALVDKLEAAGERVDILINNAGFGKLGPLTDYPVETWEEMVTLNATTLTGLTRLLLPSMLKRGAGGILNVASLASYTPAPYFAVYAATKAYVLSFTEGLHEELRGTGIHVTALAPGPTATGFFDRADMDRGVGGITESAEKVAQVGLEALARSKRVVVSGALHKTLAVATRITPKALSLRVARTLMLQAND